ncbi:MBL fold metallo-hydrolase [Paenibacillus rhizovicinus]|uniref:MBL fold metallo-hydrolase n=1 Tax=Paenibacillus rhizovicinus TaxID=2704463 RepID=A0A6C0P426_9BACL|nr:MBL fold metallo-hydrolase [Paenibacillus rhizovicinus]QHW33016.1 MBL fold metallo-hydrolase [Paenibacillus rhizovicinus]
MDNCLKQLETVTQAEQGAAWTWLGQGGFAWRFGGGPAIVIDPYLSDTVEKQDGLTRLSPAPLLPEELTGGLLLLTHDHLDHFDEPSVIQAVTSAGMKVAGPGSVEKHYRKLGLPENAFTRLDRGGKYSFNGVRIRAVYAEHSSGDGEFDAVGFVLDYEGCRIYHVGDSELTEELLHAAGDMEADCIAVPINGRWGNMNADEAASLTIRSGARLAIPMHFGMFAENTADPASFVAAMQEAGAASVEIAIPEQGRVQGIVRG